MNILADLIEVFLYPLAPETPRGWLFFSTIYGLLVSAVLAYTLLNPPAEGGIAMFLAFFGSSLAMFFSVLQYIREPNDRGLAVSTVAMNGLAVILALAIWF